MQLQRAQRLWERALSLSLPLSSYPSLTHTHTQGTFIAWGCDISMCVCVCVLGAMLKMMSCGNTRIQSLCSGLAVQGNATLMLQQEVIWKQT